MCNLYTDEQILELEDSQQDEETEEVLLVVIDDVICSVDALHQHLVHCGDTPPSVFQAFIEVENFLEQHVLLHVS